jgi:predicted ribonuclease toxin of YeeF-YezG toxin-antitoxin module
MCNPRRVRVRATRELAEAWAQEVRRQATRTGRAAGEARVREALADSVGGPTLAALTDVLARTGGWTELADGTFTHELDGGVLIFDPATRELEIAATVSAEVSVTEEASTTVDAQISGTVEAEGEGVYYDDGWGGHTAETAQRDAERNLSAAMERALRERRDQASREADAAAGDAVEREAEARAEAAFATAAAAREDELRRAAADRLMAVGVQGRALFNAALAEAYRDAIIAYARSRRASNLHHSEQDGVLDIEFELEV